MTQTKTTGKTGDALYCAKCGGRPAPNQRRLSKKGRELMVCASCLAAEKKAA